MILTLQVVGEQAANMGAGSRKVFHSIGGTIGRLPDNDWVFPDPYVSGRHALIRYLNGKYFIEDTSTNGVCINSPGNRLPRTQPQQLSNGDLLYIDAYQIRVLIENDPAASQRKDPFANLREGVTKPARAARRTPAATEVDRTAGLAMRGKDDHEDERGDDQSTEWYGMSEMSASRQPPADEDSQLRALLAAAGIVGDHQTALLAALRLAFESMLAQFDPNRLQEEFDRKLKKGSTSGGPAKLRYWDLYRENYGAMVKDAETSSRTLFGDEFAKVYEEQLKPLQALGRKQK